MNILYWTVTSVFKSDTDGAQLCHVIWNLTNREFQNCEILSLKWVNSLPKVWDLVALSEIHNSEVIVLGVVEPFDLNIFEWEILLHNGAVTTSGQVDTYNIQAKIKINKDKEIELATGDTVWWVFINACSILLKQNWDLAINSTGRITLNSTGNVEIL